MSEFKVVVLQNEASIRCGLKGQYWLHADGDMLVLQDLETRKTVMEWPYKLLRRYGRDKVSRNHGFDKVKDHHDV